MFFLTGIRDSRNKENDENGSTPINKGSAPVAQADLEKLGSELGGMMKDTQQRIFVSGDGFDELGKEEKPSRVNYFTLHKKANIKFFF